MRHREIGCFLLIIGIAVAAPPPPIGVATAQGGFRIDNAQVFGNGTLSDGALVETDRSASELLIGRGARLMLGANSRGRIYRDRLVLEKGDGQLSAGVCRIEAAGLRVLPAAAGAGARVSLAGSHRVQVAALSGALRVTSEDGIVLANVRPGAPLEFDAQAAGAAAPTRLRGKLDSRYLLPVEGAGITVELRPGDRARLDLAKFAGKCVEVTGTVLPGRQPVAGAAQLVSVESVQPCGQEAATAAAGGAAAGGAAAAGMATATKVVIAGVIIGGAAGGTAVAKAITRDDSRTISPSTSR